MGISYTNNSNEEGVTYHGPSGSSLFAGLYGPSVERLKIILETERDGCVRSLCDASPDLNSLVHQYVSRLFIAIERRIDEQHVSDDENFEGAVKAAIAREGTQLYYAAGRDVLGPLVVRFVENVLAHAPRGATVAFLARDAEPHYRAAKIIGQMPEFLDKDLQLRYVTLNRQHLKIFDENFNRAQPTDVETEQQELMEVYLRQERFDNPNGVVIVDTGCWGTMVEKLFAARAIKGRESLNLQQVHFMYSHNPGVYGFVNDVAIKGGAPDLAKEGVFVADTFECLPKRNESSTRFRCGERGTVEPVLVPIDSPYLPVWQGGVLTGIDASARTFVEKRATFPTALEAVHSMERKRIEARSEFTGVLHEATPKWSQGDAYLARWSLPPISPQR